MQGDNISVPRMARATAKVSLELRGNVCVKKSFDNQEQTVHSDGTPLNEGISWLILIDGLEEASSNSNVVTVFLPGLEVGQHRLESKYSRSCGFSDLTQ